MAKRKKKVVPTHVVFIVWNDAWVSPHADEIDVKCRPFINKTAGLLVEENEAGYKIVAEIGEDEEPEHIVFIPRGMVRRMRRFKIQWEKE